MSEKYALVTGVGQNDLGFYVADDEPVTTMPSKALTFDSFEQAKNELIFVNICWPCTFIVARFE